jgi:hypothetical protein
MTPADLRAFCDSLNNERGTGGQTRLAHLLGWHHSTIWRNLNCLPKIPPFNELAVRQVITSLIASSSEDASQV